MFVRSKLADFFLRTAVCMVIGVVFAMLISEGSFLLLQNKETVNREPRQVEIVIPFGTAGQVAQGVSNRTLPADMVFIQGDVLIVKNEDTVAHQLGPLFVLPQTSGVLQLDTADRFTYECSFQASKYMGLDVRPSLETGIQIQGILAIALPTGMMLAVYSYLIPTRKREQESLAGR